MAVVPVAVSNVAGRLQNEKSCTVLLKRTSNVGAPAMVATLAPTGRPALLIEEQGAQVPAARPIGRSLRSLPQEPPLHVRT